MMNRLYTTGMVLAQEGPPTEPQELPPDAQGQLIMWVSLALGVLAIFATVALALMGKEIANARNEGREPAQIVDRLLTVVVVIVIGSAAGSIAGFLYMPAH